MTTNPVLEVAGVTSSAPNGTTLLDDVSFTVERGWLVAVVGPTGAGKSSLAKALLGQLVLSAGTVRVTGQGVGDGRPGRVASVPQDDATHPKLSLRRTLEHAAALRVDATPAKRRQSVDTVLAELGLTGRAGTLLADLSGGERKRANVAVELVGRPDLLVLDEPTAGLDPGFEKSVFANLRSLADTGRTIVAITHSVRVLDVCDRVLFLAPGGVVAFFGTPAEAAAYFAWNDPADAYAALSTEPAASWKARFAAHQAGPPGSVTTVRSPLRRESRPTRTEAGRNWPIDPARTEAGPDQVLARMRATAHPTATAPAAPHQNNRGRSGHLRTLLHRAVHVASSDRRTLGLSLAAGPLLGALLWAVLPDGTLGPAPEGDVETGAPRAAVFAFFLAMTITWLAAAGAAREVVKERHILHRELGVGVTLTTYVTGKAVFLSAIAALQALPLAAIALINQQAPSRGPALGSGIAEIVGIALLVGLAAVATGLLISSWASSSEKAMTVLPVILIAQLALAGPWAENRSEVLEVLRHLVPARWAAAAVSATVVGDASSWWAAVAWLGGLVVVQLAAALALLHHTTPSPEGDGRDRLNAAGNRLATARPAGIRLVPIGLALVLALAAGAGALGRAGTTSPQSEAVAMAAEAAPASEPAPLPAPAQGFAVDPQAQDPAPAPVSAAPEPVPGPDPAPTRPSVPLPAAPSARPAPGSVPVSPQPPAPAAAAAPGVVIASSPTSPPTTKPAPRPTATYSTSGGVVRVSCSGFFIELLSAIPRSGYTVKVLSGGPGNVDVRFLGYGREHSVKAACFGEPFRYYEQTPPR